MSRTGSRARGSIVRREAVFATVDAILRDKSSFDVNEVHNRLKGRWRELSLNQLGSIMKAHSEIVADRDGRAGGHWKRKVIK